jgi:redox-sensitive bicupin YhaK (pirin superfamily)
LAGRQLGQDFAAREGWNMYHGLTVPGFPQHPHRGFETVTIVRKGLVDHADSLGATARFGGGDVQWLTAGRGILHSEMFPLLQTDAANPLELFQIWLNLPSRNKMAAPHFTMFWSESIPTLREVDAAGRSTVVSCIAGRLADLQPLSPPPDSWASQAGADVAIWTLKLDAGARYTLPPATGSGTRRQLYFFKGRSLSVDGQVVGEHGALELRADQPAALLAGPDGCEGLVLQGRPIGEPVAQVGPFVMNTREELQQAFSDYQQTQFGGWPWPDSAPVHGASPERQARHADGRLERPPAPASSHPLQGG